MNRFFKILSSVSKLKAEEKSAIFERKVSFLRKALPKALIIVKKNLGTYLCHPPTTKQLHVSKWNLSNQPQNNILL